MTTRTRRTSGAQTSKVYAAERDVFDVFTEDYNEAQAQRYIDHLFSLKWVQKRWGVRPRVRVEATNRTRGHAFVWGSKPLIAIPAKGCSEYLLLHEAAHILNRCEGNGHRWDFCDTELRLVQNRMGKAKADELRAAYRRHKVRYTKPQKRAPLSPERREANIARLAEARAKADQPKEVAPGFWWAKVEAGHYTLATPEHGIFHVTKYDKRNRPIGPDGHPAYGAYIRSGAWIVTNEDWQGYDVEWEKLTEVRDYLVEACRGLGFSSSCWVANRPGNWSVNHSVPQWWDGDHWSSNRVADPAAADYGVAS